MSIVFGRQPGILISKKCLKSAVFWKPQSDRSVAHSGQQHSNYLPAYLVEATQEKYFCVFMTEFARSTSNADISIQNN